MKFSTLITLFIYLLLHSGAMAQDIHCNMVKLPMEQLIQQSNAIAHVRVLQENSFWNQKHSMIFTHYRLEVLQSFKGELFNEITLVVEGGRAQGMLLDYQDRIDVQPGAEFVAMLSEVPKHWECDVLPEFAFAAYASKQGIFEINPTTGACSDVFKRYETLEDLTRVIAKETRMRVVPEQHKYVPSPVGSTSIAAVASFSPATVSAGTGTLLTISGSGFGTTRGNGFVEFTIVDGSFAQPLAKDYVLWSDTQIQLYVPSLTVFNGAVKETAATGPIRVTPDGGVAAASPTSLNVRYSLFNRYNSPEDSSVTQRMINANSLGGYTFQYNNQFSALGAGAQSTLERALSTWKCATSVNFSIASTTTTIRTVAVDNVSVITDDVLSPLPAGILGRGVNLSGLCNNGPIVRALVIEKDLIVTANPPAPWNFTSSAPTASQLDFETVMLHEFGHVHQLAHTRNGSTNVMAPTVSYGFVNRSLAAVDLEGAQDAIARSSATAGCGYNPHVTLTPTVSITSNITLPACNPAAITFTASTTNMTANTVLNWFRNGVMVAQGSTYTLNAPVNNDAVFCQYSACTTIRSNTITIAISNNAATISYASPYCKSVTTAQSVTRTGASGGTYSASPAGLSINASTGAITPSASTVGTYTVTYTVPASGPCSVFSTTASVTIAAAPTVSMVYGAANYCKSQTGSVSPTTSGSGPIIYTVTPAGLTFNTSTGAFTPSTSAPGTYTITARVNGTGACSGSFVTVVRTITIIAPLSTPGTITGSLFGVCASTKTYSIAAVANASSYTWTVPAGATISGASTGTSISVVFTGSFTSGTISVRANSSTGCNSALRSITVNGVPGQPLSIGSTAPILGVTTCNILAVSGATSYVWTVSGASILSGQGTTSITILGGLFSSANVCVRAVNACGQSSQQCRSVNTFQNTNGQQGAMAPDEVLSSDRFVAPTIYPNPAENLLNVSFEESDVQGDVTIDVLDGGGLLIHRAYYNQIHGTSLQLSLQDFPVGMYVLRMQSKDGTIQTQRFIKQ
jgi:hypothetical protein